MLRIHSLVLQKGPRPLLELLVTEVTGSLSRQLSLGLCCMDFGKLHHHKHSWVLAEEPAGVLTNFFNKQRPLKYNEDDEAMRASLRLAAVCCTFAPLPARAAEIPAARTPQPSWCWRRHRVTSGCRCPAAAVSVGRGGSDASCGTAVTMTLRTSSGENSSRGGCGTKLRQLRCSARGSLAGRCRMPAAHLHRD